MESKFNPAPLGLIAFGMTTILLNLHNAGFYELNAMILAMGICYGGVAQLFAGFYESRRGNTFGTVVFTSYGLFWLSLVAIWVLPKLGWADKADAMSMACYLGMWGLLTLFFFFCTLGGNWAGKLIFATLTVLFALLAAASISHSELLHMIAGYEGIVCGALAFYEGVAVVVHEKVGRKIFPLV